MATSLSFYVPAHAASSAITYGPLPEEVAELCQPDADPGARPAILLIHGDGWTDGDKAMLSRRCQLLAGYGYTVLNINYRLGTGIAGHNWSAGLEDARRALAWLQSNAESLNVDKARIGVIGQSAGGQLALFLGAAGQSGGVRCVVAESAPINRLGGPPALLQAGPLPPPVTGIGKTSAPTMIVHGRDDEIVPFSQGQGLLGALRRNKVPAVILAYDGGHVLQNTLPDERDRVFYAEIAYLKAYLAPGDRR